MRKSPSPGKQTISGSKHGPEPASATLMLKYSRPEEMKRDCLQFGEVSETGAFHNMAERCTDTCSS